MPGNNKLNNHQLTHNAVGFFSDRRGQSNVKLGKRSVNSKESDFQIPVNTILRNAIQSSPYSFRTYGEVSMHSDLSGAYVYEPSVLYSNDNFGQGKYDSNQHERENKPWRMYFMDPLTSKTYMLESDDGIDFDTYEQLSTTLFPTGATKMAAGFHVFYDEDGIVTVSGTSYNFAAILRQSSLTTGDATDLFLYYSDDGVTWNRVQMGNHDVTGSPLAELASSLSDGMAYMGKTESDAGTYDIARPKTFRNAPGDWWGIVRYATAPAHAGDTVLGETIVAMNSTDAADYNEMGHFANWKRKLLRQLGENSYGQLTNAQVRHVVKFKDYYVGLVQLYYQVAGATQNLSGIAIAISRDGLIFDYIGPLYDAGLYAAYNERSTAVNITDMKPTAWGYNAGLGGTGNIIGTGSIVMDDSGRSFGTNSGDIDEAHFSRVYWHEGGKLLMGYF